MSFPFSRGKMPAVAKLFDAVRNLGDFWGLGLKALIFLLQWRE